MNLYKYYKFKLKVFILIYIIISIKIHEKYLKIILIFQNKLI